jgi:dolichyl-phosphate beta-glucosyltransferase
MVPEAPRLTVIVPAFNEAIRLSEGAALLEEAVGNGSLCPEETELIFVDDGSTDETGWRAEELLASRFPLLRVLRLHDNAGKGAAIRLGTAAATAPVVLFMDADMSVDPSQIPHLVKAIGPADVAIGSRSLNESVVECDNMHRRVMGWTFNIVVSSLTKMPFRDTQCGFKAMRTPLARVLFHLMQVKRFAFDVELLSLARQLQMEIAEIAVHWCEVGDSRVRAFADSVEMARDVLHVRSRREWPHLPALVVTPAPGERRRSQSRAFGDIHRSLGPNFPILSLSEDQSMVLLPLCDPLEVQTIADRLRMLPTKLTVRERSLSFPQLMERTPFRWIDGESGGLVVGLQSGVSELTIRAPVGGWETVRSRGGGTNEVSLNA